MKVCIHKMLYLINIISLICIVIASNPQTQRNDIFNENIRNSKNQSEQNTNQIINTSYGKEDIKTNALPVTNGINSNTNSHDTCNQDNSTKENLHIVNEESTQNNETLIIPKKSLWNKLCSEANKVFCGLCSGKDNNCYKLATCSGCKDCIDSDSNSYDFSGCNCGVCMNCVMLINN